MVMVVISNNQLATDEFIINDSDGNLVLGLINANFTRDLFDPNGNEVSATIIPTITELGAGKYRVTFIPNLIGNWVLTIFHNIYFPNGKIENYLCQEGGTLNPNEIADAVWDENINDHLGANSTGGTVYSTKKVAGRGVNITGLWSKDEKDNLIKKLIEIEKTLKELEDSLENKVNKLPQLEAQKADLTPVLDKLVVESEKTEKNNQNFIYYQKAINSYLTGIKSEIENISKLLVRSCPDEILEEAFDGIQRRSFDGNEKPSNKNQGTE